MNTLEPELDDEAFVVAYCLGARSGARLSTIAEVLGCDGAEVVKRRALRLRGKGVGLPMLRQGRDNGQWLRPAPLLMPVRWAADLNALVELVLA